MDFQVMFKEAGVGPCEPVEYEGKMLYLMDEWYVGSEARVRVTFDSTDADSRQGVELWAQGATWYVNEEEIKSRTLILWSDSAPKVVDIGIVGATGGRMVVNNAWENHWGRLDSRHHGAAMIREGRGATRRTYRCNDGEPDEDFSDIVFTVDVEVTRID